MGEGPCAGACGRYRAGRPASGRRYEAGQALCQACGVWLDRRGARLEAGGPAGWRCRCCGCRMYRQSRDAPYGRRKGGGAPRADLGHFNRRRARLLGALGGAIAEKGSGSARSLRELLLRRMPAGLIGSEFGAETGRLLELAHSDLPNRVSLIAELEMLRLLAGKVPTGREIEAAGRFSVAEYEAEFGSLGRLLEMLGYGPRG